MSKKLLFVVTEDWYFVSHRLALGVAAVSLGYEVIVATRVTKHRDEILKAGIRVIPFELSRRSGNPLKEIFNLFRMYRSEAPDVIHHVALKPVIYGSIASWFASSNNIVNAVSGLGWMFTSPRWVVRILQAPIRWVMCCVLNQKNSITIIQNTTDREFLCKAGVDRKQIRLIRGAGVDVNYFYPNKNSLGVPCIMLAARMLWDKGIAEFVEAARILFNRGIIAKFVLVGGLDPANPANIPIDVLRDWHGKWGVEYWGRREDMLAVWHSADIACLPSYREGMPKSLLEAASCGIPIVTTDVPGCQEVIDNGEEGFLIPPKDPIALANALALLIERPELRVSMGAKSRKRAENIFCQEGVISETFKIYDELFNKRKKNMLHIHDNG